MQCSPDRGENIKGNIYIYIVRVVADTLNGINSPDRGRHL